MHTALGKKAVSCDRAAADETTAADAHDHVVNSPDLFDDLTGDGALASDHVPLVERGHEGHTGYLGLSLDDLVDIFLVAVKEVELGTVTGHGVHFKFRRIVRDNDAGLYAENSAGQRDSLTMITRRVSEHSLGLLLVRQLADSVEGAAELEAARLLQVFTLEEDFDLLGGICLVTKEFVCNLS